MAKGDNTAAGPKYGGNVYGGFFKPSTPAPQMGSGSNPYGNRPPMMGPTNPNGPSYGIGPSPGNTPPPQMWNPTGPRMNYNNPAPPIQQNPYMMGNQNQSFLAGDQGPGVAPTMNLTDIIAKLYGATQPRTM